MPDVPSSVDLPRSASAYELSAHETGKLVTCHVVSHSHLVGDTIAVFYREKPERIGVDASTDFSHAVR